MGQRLTQEVKSVEQPIRKKKENFEMKKVVKGRLIAKTPQRKTILIDALPKSNKESRKKLNTVKSTKTLPDDDNDCLSKRVNENKTGKIITSQEHKGHSKNETPVSAPVRNPQSSNWKPINYMLPKKI